MNHLLLPPKQLFLPLSSKAFPAMMLGVMLNLSQSANAQHLDQGNISISPSEPIANWMAPRDLFPDESVTLQINVTSTGIVNGKEYALENGSPKIHLNKPQSLWTTIQGKDGDTLFMFEILNSGEAPSPHSVEVKAKWITKGNGSNGGGGGGGGGDDGSDDSIHGSATGDAYNDIPIFTWIFDPRLQFADGLTPIDFTATTAVAGATLNLNNYTIHGEANWNIVTQINQPHTISGSVDTDIPSKGKLKITFNGNHIDESVDEIAFGKVDLAIASSGSEADLIEDRLPGGGVAPTPHEMDPGSVVIAPIASIEEGGKNLTPGRRAKLTVSGNGGMFLEGAYTLSADANLTKLKIYEAVEGGEPIALPIVWAASELENPKTLYVGSEAFRPEDEFQIGKLSLTYKLPLQADGRTHELKDEVKVTLTTIEVIELFPKVKDDDGNDLAGSEKPNWGMPLTPFVEENPHVNRIAHRELKVRIGSAAMANKKVTWTLEALPGATPATIRGEWSDSPKHKNCFEKSVTYGEPDYTDAGTGKDTKAVTTVSADGHTAIRVNVPPIGFNQVRIKIQVEGMSAPINLIDMKVPAVIVIDPGHGIGQAAPSNAIGATGISTKVTEHEAALDIGKRMAEKLRQRREEEGLLMRVLMTRKDTTNINFRERTGVARENGCDVYVSLHFNGVKGKPLRRHPFGMWDTTGNYNIEEDKALAIRIRKAVQRAIAEVEPKESREDKTDGITSENHEANVQKPLDTCSDSTSTTNPNYNGNVPGYTPCRAALIELEWMSNIRADILFNEGNAPLSETADSMREAAAREMADAIIEDIRLQPK